MSRLLIATAIAGTLLLGPAWAQTMAAPPAASAGKTQMQDHAMPKAKKAKHMARMSHGDKSADHSADALNAQELQSMKQ